MSDFKWVKLEKKRMVWKNRNYDFSERHYDPYFLKKNELLSFFK